MYYQESIIRKIPVARASRILTGVKNSGISLEELFTACEIPLEKLEDKRATIEKHEFIALIFAAQERTQDEYLGLSKGHKSKPGTFKMLAHSVINCANLDKALHRCLQFYQVVDSPVETRIEIREDEFVLSFQSIDEDDDKSLVEEVSLFVLVRFASWLIGQEIVPKAVFLRVSLEEAGLKELKDFPMPFNVKLGQESTSVIIDKSYLQMPLVQNSLSLSNFLKSSLERIIDGNIQNASLNAQIRGIISKEFGSNFPDYSVICSKLNMTPQTLRRRLKEEHTSYQEIKDGIRKDASIYYLSNPDLSIEEIALLMGFSEASSFHRAFKKWTGKTPSNYRTQMASLS